MRFKTRPITFRLFAIFCTVSLVAGLVPTEFAIASAGKVTKKSLLAALRANPRAVASGPAQPLVAQWGARLVNLNPALAPAIAALAEKEAALANTINTPARPTASFATFGITAPRAIATGAQTDGGFLSPAIIAAALTFGTTQPPPPAVVGTKETSVGGGSFVTSVDGKGGLGQGFTMAATVEGEAGPVALSQGLTISGSACPTAKGTLEFTVDIKNNISGNAVDGRFADERQVTGKVTARVNKDSTISSVAANLRVQTRLGTQGDTPYVDALVSTAVSHTAGQLGERAPGPYEQSGTWTSTIKSAAVTRTSSTANVENVSAAISDANAFAISVVTTYLRQVEFGLRSNRCKRDEVLPTTSPPKASVPKSPPKSQGASQPTPLLMRVGFAFSKYDIDYSTDGYQFSFRLQQPPEVKPLYFVITPAVAGVSGTLQGTAGVDGGFSVAAVRTITGKGPETVVNVSETFALSFESTGVAAGQAVTPNTRVKVRFRLDKCCFDPMETDFRLGDLLRRKTSLLPGSRSPEIHRYLRAVRH